MQGAEPIGVLQRKERKKSSASDAGVRIEKEKTTSAKKGKGLNETG